MSYLLPLPDMQSKLSLCDHMIQQQPCCYLIIVHAKHIIHEVLIISSFILQLQSKLIDVSLLSPSEINWVNDYHEEVWDKVSLYILDKLNYLYTKMRLVVWLFLQWLPSVCFHDIDPCDSCHLQLEGLLICNTIIYTLFFNPCSFLCTCLSSLIFSVNMFMLFNHHHIAL